MVSVFMMLFLPCFTSPVEHDFCDDRCLLPNSGKGGSPLFIMVMISEVVGKGLAPSRFAVVDAGALGVSCFT
jgi:hypothetical protein